VLVSDEEIVVPLPVDVPDDVDEPEPLAPLTVPVEPLVGSCEPAVCPDGDEDVSPPTTVGVDSVVPGSTGVEPDDGGGVVTTTDDGSDGVVTSTEGDVGGGESDDVLEMSVDVESSVTVCDETSGPESLVIISAVAGAICAVARASLPYDGVELSVVLAPVDGVESVGVELGVVDAVDGVVDGVDVDGVDVDVAGVVEPGSSDGGSAPTAVSPVGCCVAGVGVVEGVELEGEEICCGVPLASTTTDAFAIAPTRALRTGEVAYAPFGAVGVLAEDEATNEYESRMIGRRRVCCFGALYGATFGNVGVA
jgi:hypothetical protein